MRRLDFILNVRETLTSRAVKLCFKKTNGKKRQLILGKEPIKRGQEVPEGIQAWCLGWAAEAVNREYKHTEGRLTGFAAKE